jgi:hypothetical protein
MEAHDEAQIALVMERVARLRASLERRGTRLSDVLEQGETVRAMAHAGHRY